MDMVELLNPVGVKVRVSPEKAEGLVTNGYSRIKNIPAKPTPPEASEPVRRGRPRKDSSED